MLKGMAKETAPTSKLGSQKVGDEAAARLLRDLPFNRLAVAADDRIPVRVARRQEVGAALHDTARRDVERRMAATFNHLATADTPLPVDLQPDAHRSLLVRV